jgi:hypothetical protein
MIAQIFDVRKFESALAGHALMPMNSFPLSVALGSFTVAPGQADFVFGVHIDGSEESFEKPSSK